MAIPLGSFLDFALRLGILNSKPNQRGKERINSKKKVDRKWRGNSEIVKNTPKSARKRPSCKKYKIK